MFQSLIILNYRNLKELKINSLGRVNLITGNNNTGKSTLLEAISLYASNGDLSLIFELLAERGEYFQQLKNENNLTETNIRGLATLFTDRKISFERKDSITIETSVSNQSSSKKEISTDSKLSIRFVKFVDEIQRDNQGDIISRKRILLNSENEHLDDFKIGLEIGIGNRFRIISIDRNIGKEDRIGFQTNGLIIQSDKIQFIRTRNIEKDINGLLFDKIALTEKEQFVIDALKIIEPNTERIAFIEEPGIDRSAVIKLANTSIPLPIKSMGDGINRILTIILALINSDDGVLLIDEFENGLHHTVQEKLWTIIFNLSQKLEVQVFVTTHSEDCIAGFEKVLNSQPNTLDGKLIRLDNVNGVIKQVEFTAEELKIATDQNIEIR